jgi:hypothetical protein
VSGRGGERGYIYRTCISSDLNRITKMTTQEQAVHRMEDEWRRGATTWNEVYK